MTAPMRVLRILEFMEYRLLKVLTMTCSSGSYAKTEKYSIALSMNG